MPISNWQFEILKEISLYIRRHTGEKLSEKKTPNEFHVDECVQTMRKVKSLSQSFLTFTQNTFRH